MIFGQHVNGELVHMGQTSGMTDGQRMSMSMHPEQWTGRAVQIEGMERLKSGAIRHPRYKGISQKKPSDCTYYEGEQ